MRIFNFGLDIEIGKRKHKDVYFDKLVEKFSPKKETPYTVEFVDTDMERSDAVVFSSSKKLDFILGDLERIENRLLRSEDEEERNLLARVQKILEEEKLLCNVEFLPQEETLLRQLQLVTCKPSLEIKEVSNIDDLIKTILKKAGVILFFTVGKKEVRAWSLKQGESVLEAAGKIHSDLKRGFIKADIVSQKDVDSFFNMAEARARGFVNIVDKDYIVQPNDVIEIKFNV